MFIHEEIEQAYLKSFKAHDPARVDVLRADLRRVELRRRGRVMDK